MTKNWQQAAELQLESEFISKQPLGGGDFAESFHVTLADSREVFIKTHTNPPPYFFSTEAAGLQWLAQTSEVNVPEVLAFSDEPPFLVLQWVQIGQRKASTEVEFGRQLAKLHQGKFECFGRPDKRTTGSQAVPNEPCDSWVEFYASRRLLPLAKLASEKGALKTSCIKKIELLSTKLDSFTASAEKPSLLHGDLWAGNRVVDSTGKSWLIDPAAHGGHREFDLAMMRLFGGYEPECFASYKEMYPLEEGWQERISLHQLAPLMVHAIKFGSSYAAATEQAVSEYV